MATTVRDEMKNVLLKLTEDERKLLSRVIQVERENLHQKAPQKAIVRGDLVKAVKETIK